MDNHSVYITPAEAAELIGIARGSLANWRLARRGPPYYVVGSRIRYRLDEIHQWMQVGRVTTDDASAEAGR